MIPVHIYAADRPVRKSIRNIHAAHQILSLGGNGVPGTIWLPPYDCILRQSFSMTSRIQNTARKRAEISRLPTPLITLL